jgi:tetratricopeptide (TPR) repeat protein
MATRRFGLSSPVRRGGGMERMPDSGLHYWAFLSYSHADARWANRLHRGLEHFATPRRLVGAPTPAGPAPRRLHPIFRDREELGASADLGGRLIAALEASAYLIVVCSPSAARSRWVNQEIERFRAVHGDERILSVIVGGRPHASLDDETADDECFPEALRHEAGDPTKARTEPIAADLRPGRDGYGLAVLKLAAGMLGVGLDELVQRDARRRQRQLVAVTGGSLAASAILAALAVAAVLERNEAYAQRTQAEGLVEFMIGDLKTRLEPIGALDALDAVGGRALSYYADQKSHGLDAESLGRRARVLHLLGEIRDRRGDLAGALGLFQEAAKSTGALLARAPDDPRRIFDHAQSTFWVGDVAYRRGHDDDARRAFTEYQRLADRLVQIDPGNKKWRNEVEYASSDLGTLLLDDGQPGGAAQAYQRAVDISESLARDGAGDRNRQWDLATNLAWLSDAQTLLGQIDSAEKNRLAERAIYIRLLEQNPADNDAKAGLAWNRSAMARILIDQGRSAAALGQLEAANTDLERLTAQSPADASYKDHAENTLLLIGRLQLGAGDLDAAEHAVGRAREIAEAAVRKDPTATDWSGEQLGLARLLAMRIAAARARSTAGQAEALQPARAEAARLAALAQARPSDYVQARVAAEADLLAGDAESLVGDVAGGRSDWSAGLTLLRAAGLPNQPPGDASGALLRQLDYRLRYSSPPLGAGGASSSSSDAQKAQRLVDYRW